MVGFTHYNRNVLRRLLTIVILLALTVACGNTPVKTKPMVDVISPRSGALIAPGEQVSLRVAAASANQIKRVEARVNNILVTAQDNPSSGMTFSTQLQFTPQQGGPITISVTAVDAMGQSSDPIAIALLIGSGSIFTEPVSTSPITGTTQTLSDCRLAASFVADVTIPDNTVVKAGSTLVKTWQIRNTSQCAWETGYSLAYLDGARLDSPDSVAVPPTARDATVDVSVPFTAPQGAGTYTSTWRLRNPDGIPFGNRVFMIIQVP